MSAAARLVLALLICIGSIGSARAGEPDASHWSTARALAVEGLQLYDAGDYAAALARFERAEQLVGAPTMTLMAARTLDKLGRLVEASERYLRVMRAEIAPDASAAFRAAPARAAEERAAVLQRVPAIELVVVGDGTGLVVTLDGRRLPRGAFGVRWPVDPGAHLLTWRHHLGASSQRFEIAPREQRRLTITVPPRPGWTTAAPTPDGASTLDPTVGWAVLGVGAALLVAGGVMGAVTLAERAALDEAGCVDQVCPADLGGRVDRYNALRVASAIGSIAGATFAGVGLALAITARAGRSPSAATGLHGRW